MQIRKEDLKDQDSVFAVNSAAFERPYEANIVNILRAKAEPIITLVAEDNDKIVGHIMFSPVLLQKTSKVMGLAPMAVLPQYQRQGIGILLVKAGLDECRKLDVGAVVVLGHPEYYPRFSFSPAHHFGLECEYEAPEEAFMVKELKHGFLDNASGIVKYHDAFKNV